MSGVLRAFTFRRRLLKPIELIRSPKKKSYYIPPSQYDTPLPWTLHPFKASMVFLELIPILIQSAISLGLAFGYIVYMLKYKTDMVFTTHNRDMPCRTMDLCHPVRYKLFNFTQTDIFQPWPEMQMILDKMKAAEQRLIAKASSCPMEDPARPCPE